MNASKNIRFLVPIISLGIVLRVLSTHTYDFWFDEAYTYQIANLPFPEFWEAALSDNNPPIYYLMIKAILQKSQNELIIRFPSVIGGILTLVLVYKISKKLSSAKVARVAVALCAVSPLLIYLSSEARPHSIAIFFSMLVVYVFLKLLEKPKSALFILISLLLTLGALVQYYILLLILPFSLIFLKRYRKFRVVWLLALSLPILTLAMWFFKSYEYYHTTCYCPNMPLSIIYVLISPTVNMIGQITLGELLSKNSALFGLLMIPPAIFAFLFARAIFSSKLKLIYLIPFVFLSIISIKMPVFSPKAFAIFSPLFLIIASESLAKNSKILITTLVFSMLIITILQISHHTFSGEKLKKAFSITQKSGAPVFHNSVLSYYSFCFYAKSCSNQVLLGQNPLPKVQKDLFGGNQEQFRPKSKNIWLVDTLKWTNENRRQKQIEKIFTSYFPIDKVYLDNLTIYSAIRR